MILIVTVHVEYMCIIILVALHASSMLLLVAITYKQLTVFAFRPLGLEVTMGYCLPHGTLVGCF